jgi:hypothetical protein
LDFISLLRIMARRWFVVVPVLIATVAFGLTFVSDPQIEFSASGSELLVIDPDEAAPSRGVAPSVAVGVLASSLDQQSYRSGLEERGLASDYTIEADAASAVVSLVFRSTQTGQVLATGEAIVSEIDEVLASVLGATEASSVRLTPVGQLTERDVISFDDEESLTLAVAVLQATAERGNPYGPNNATVRVLLETAERPEVGEQVAQAAPTAAYDVVANPRDPAPIIDFVIVASEAADVEPAYVALGKALDEQLLTLQTDVGVVSSRTTLMSLSPPAAFTQTSGSSVRPIAGIALLGIAVACGLAIALDSFMLRRKSKLLVSEDE